MKEENKKERKCPICKRTYNEPPALSRKDNKTLICSDCGTIEAFHDMVEFQIGGKRNE